LTMKKMKRLTIVKIGGEVIDDSSRLQVNLKAFAAMPGDKILVHGGGKSASQWCLRLGIQPRFVDGRRITDTDTLPVMQMVYAGLLNKNIVGALQAMDCNALGLTGADADTIRADKRPVGDIDYGLAGDIREIRATMILRFLEAGLVPVFCPLTHDGRNQFFNTNADTIAARLGSALVPHFQVQVIFCFGRPGVLADEADDRSLISHLTGESYRELLKGGIIKDGMIPKLENAFKALAEGVQKIYIIHADSLPALSRGVETGTALTLE
jgi:acetylglutamate kinase